MEAIQIQGTEQYTGVYVGTVGNNVWINVLVKNGGANICIRPDNAEKLIEQIRIAIKQVEYEG